MKIERTLPLSAAQSLAPGELLGLKGDLWNIINHHFIKLLTETRTLENRALLDFVSRIWVSVFHDTNQGMPYYTIDLSFEMKRRFIDGSLPQVLLFGNRIADCPAKSFNRQAFKTYFNEVLNQYGLGYTTRKKSTHTIAPKQLSVHNNYSL